RTEVVASVRSLLELADRVAGEARTQAEGEVRQARLIMAVAAGVATVVGLAVSLILGGQVAAPVVAIARSAARLADGDLTVEPLRVRNRDELGDMAAAFNRMLDNMRAMLEHVSRSTL